MKDTKKRALEIERSIIDDAINYDRCNGVDAFISFITSDDMSGDEVVTLTEIIKQSLQAPFADRHKPINALVCRAVEWQAERLARLEEE